MKNILLLIFTILTLATPAFGDAPQIWGPLGAQQLNSGNIIAKDSSVYPKFTEKNYISGGAWGVGTAGALTWTASGAGITCTTATTNLTDASVSATSLAVTGASGSTAFCYADFVVDSVDYGKVLKFAFDQLPVTYTASNFQVSVNTCTTAWGSVTPGVCSGTSTRLPLSTDASSITALPNLTGTFRTTFSGIAAAAPNVQIQIGLNSANTSQVNFGNIVVGPGPVTQGAQLSQWQSYTPTITGNGSKVFTIGIAQYRRVGDSLELQFEFDGNSTASGGSGGNFTFSIPSGYTIPSTFNFGALGFAQWYSVATANQIDPAGFVQTATTTTLEINKQGSSVAYSSTDLNVARAMNVYGHVTFPANELAGSGTVNVAQNDVEYAYNSSTSTTASDSTSFAYGPGGAQIQSITAQLDRTVQFPTPFQVGDYPVVEIWDGTAGDPWLQVNATVPSNTPLQYQYQDTVTYGVGIKSNTVSGQVVVHFGQYSSPTATTFGGVGTTWSPFSGFYWRVRKIKGGVAVGFSNYNPGVSAGLVSVQGLPGSTSGSSPGAGYAGESFTGGASLSAVTSTYNATEAWATTGTMNLTAGNWLITATGSGFTTVPSAGSVGCDIRMQDTTNSVTVQLANDVAAAASTLIAGNDNEFGFSTTGYRTLSSTATVTIQIGASANSGTPTSGACNTRANGVMYAIRMP